MKLIKTKERGLAENYLELHYDELNDETRELISRLDTTLSNVEVTYEDKHVSVPVTEVLYFDTVVCISFTLVVCGKLLLEKAMGFTDRHYTENIFTCLGFSIIITAVPALHFYLRRFPLIPMLIAQYTIVIGATVGFVKLADIVADTNTNAMRQMILSVIIPFIISAVFYYITFFKQIKKANDIIAEINKAFTDQ